jgi:hypothetical protein
VSLSNFVNSQAGVWLLISDSKAGKLTVDSGVGQALNNGGSQIIPTVISISTKT